MLIRHYLDEVESAGLGLGAKLPLALCVCIVDLPWELLGVFILTNQLRLIYQTWGLSCAVNNTHVQITWPTSLLLVLSLMCVCVWSISYTRGSGWGTGDCRMTRRTLRCSQPVSGTWCCPLPSCRDFPLHHGSSQNWDGARQQSARQKKSTNKLSVVRNDEYITWVT